jgi:hypothetical protein
MGQLLSSPKSDVKHYLTIRPLKKSSLQRFVDDPEMAFLTIFPPASQPVFGLRSGFDPQHPSNPVFMFLGILADFNLKINLFLSFTAILFNSYFKEKGLSRILIVFLGRKGARIRGFEDSRDQVSVFLAFRINLKPSSKGLSPSSLWCF